MTPNKSIRIPLVEKFSSTWCETSRIKKKKSLRIPLNVQQLGVSVRFQQRNRVWAGMWAAVAFVQEGSKWTDKGCPPPCMQTALSILFYFFSCRSGRRGPFQLPLMKIKLPVSDGRLLFHALPFLFQQKSSVLFLLAGLARCEGERLLHLVRASAFFAYIQIRVMVMVL